MIVRTFAFETKLLLRDRGFLLMCLALALLVGLANLNGKRQWELRQSGVETKMKQRAEADEAMIDLANSLTGGGESNVGFYDNPTNPMGIGWKQPRLATYKTGPMSLIATGHSDIYRHASEVSVYGEQAYQANFKEMRSPIQQMVGFFDLSIVLIFLFPLFALATSFNLVAADRERGSLSLLLAQGISLKKWLFARIAARYVVTLGVLGLSVIGSFALLGVLPIMPMNSLLQLVGITALYGMIWFAMAFLINLQRGGSANHGFVLVVLWAGALLVIPGGINQVARSIYPMPSRVGLVNAMRVAVAEAEHENAQTFEQFYQAHPNLKPDGEVKKNTGQGWFMNYFIVQAEAWKSLKPMLTVFDERLEQRSGFIDTLGVTSPGIPYAASLTQIAGTSHLHYRTWQNQVAAFSQEWKDFVFPRVFHNKWFEPNELKSLPTFTFDMTQVPTNLSRMFIVMLIQLLLLCAWAYFMPAPKHVHASLD